MAGVMDSINQHSVDFSKLLSNFTITIPKFEDDRNAVSDSSAAAVPADKLHADMIEHRRLSEIHTKSDIRQRYNEIKVGLKIE